MAVETETQWEVQLANVCEKRMVLAEDAARRHVFALQRSEAIGIAVKERCRNEIQRYVAEVCTLRNERSILAAEVRKLRENTPAEAAAKHWVQEQAPQVVVAAQDTVGVERWSSLPWTRREGVLLVWPVVDSLKVHAGHLQMELKEAEAQNTRTTSEADRLRQELSTSKQLCEARLTQITSEKQKLEQARATASQANTALKAARQEIAAKEAELALKSLRSASDDALSVTASSETDVLGAMPNPLRSNCEFINLGLLFQASTDTALTSAPSPEKSMSPHRDSVEQTDAPPLPRRRASTAADLYEMKAAMQQREALQQRIEELERQVSDLQACVADNGDEKLEKLVEALRRLKTQLDTVTQDRDDIKATLEDVRKKVLEFHERQKQKREALLAEIETLEKRIEESEAHEGKEREEAEAQEKELQVDGSEKEVQTAPVDMEDQAAQTDAVEIAGEPFDGEKKVNNRPDALPAGNSDDEKGKDKPDGVADTDEDTDREPKVTKDGIPVEDEIDEDAPEWMWEAGAPTLQELESQRERRCTITLRFTLGNMVHTTTVLMEDTKSVKDLLTTACKKVNNKLGLKLKPREMALTVTEKDEAAMLEWLDPDEMQFLNYEDAPLSGPLHSPTMSPRTGAKYPQFPCTNRPLRTLAFIHEKYEQLLVEDDDRVNKMWFTVAPATTRVRKPDHGTSLTATLSAKKIAKEIKAKASIPRAPGTPVFDYESPESSAFSPAASPKNRRPGHSRQTTTSPVDPYSPKPVRREKRAKSASGPVDPNLKKKRHSMNTPQSPMYQKSHTLSPSSRRTNNASFSQAPKRGSMRVPP
eukprot:gene9193-14256_t